MQECHLIIIPVVVVVVVVIIIIIMIITIISITATSDADINGLTLGAKDLQQYTHYKPPPRSLGLAEVTIRNRHNAA